MKPLNERDFLDRTLVRINFNNGLKLWRKILLRPHLHTMSKCSNVQLWYNLNIFFFFTRPVLLLNFDFIFLVKNLIPNAGPVRGGNQVNRRSRNLNKKSAERMK